MQTKYEPENARFSNLAHACARLLIYPKVFGNAQLVFENTLINKDDQKASIYDGEMGIDRIVYVTVDSLKAPLKFTIQERFRKIEYAHYRDLTVTEWNHSSNQPSELYKINAGIFLYGYFDAKKLEFGETLLINTADLLHRICANNIKYSYRTNRKQQTFLAFNFDDLNPMYHLAKSEPITDHIDISLPAPLLAQKSGLSPGQIAEIKSQL